MERRIDRGCNDSKKDRLFDQSIDREVLNKALQKKQIAMSSIWADCRGTTGDGYSNHQINQLE